MAVNTSKRKYQSCPPSSVAYPTASLLPNPHSHTTHTQGEAAHTPERGMQRPPAALRFTLRYRTPIMARGEGSLRALSLPQRSFQRRMTTHSPAPLAYPLAPALSNRSSFPPVHLPPRERGRDCFAEPGMTGGEGLATTRRCPDEQPQRVSSVGRTLIPGESSPGR